MTKNDGLQHFITNEALYSRWWCLFRQIIFHVFSVWWSLPRTILPTTSMVSRTLKVSASPQVNNITLYDGVSTHEALSLALSVYMLLTVPCFFLMDQLIFLFYKRWLFAGCLFFRVLVLMLLFYAQSVIEWTVNQSVYITSSRSRYNHTTIIERLINLPVIPPFHSLRIYSI